MSGSPLHVSVDDRGVARVELDRDQARNAFDETLIAALTDRLAELARRPSLRALVLSGRGRAFSAGADLRWMRRSADYPPDRNAEEARAFATMLQRLADFPRPTLASVHGAAYGGAVGLAAACDIAIAASSARFSLSEVRLGLEPATIAPYVLRAMGRREFLRLALTGGPFDAEEARRVGLVHEVVEDNGLGEAVERVLGALLAGGPGAQAGIKELATLADRPPDAALREATAQRIAARRASDEGRAGLAAFFAKQPPPWA